MKTALIGYGKMGKLLYERLLEKGHEICLVVDPYAKPGEKLPSGMPILTSLKDALNSGLKDCNCAIEFTAPVSAAENLLFLAENKIPVVCGTTGWYDKLPEISRAVQDSETSMVWAANYSLGVNIFYRIASYAAKLIDPFKEYDVAGLETHHNGKADSPSGTAKVLVERVMKEMTRKKKAVYDIMDRKPQEDELHFASLRVGSEHGTHSLIFDSPADTIEIVHNGRNREGLVSGAIVAAEWLCAKKRSGVFTIDDVLADILP